MKLLILALLPIVALSAAKPDELTNPGFEKGNKDGPTGWKGDGISHSRDAHGGRSAVRMATVKQGQHHGASLQHPTLLKLRPNALYLATVWAKGTGRMRIGLTEHISQRRGGVKHVGGRSSLHIDLTPQWTRYPFYYGTDEEGIDRVRFRISLDGNGAVALIDDASLKRVGRSGRPGPNVVPNGDMKAGRDGAADGWLAETLPGRKPGRLAVGADGSHAVLGWFGKASSLKPPRPNLKTWWDWSKQRFTAAGYASIRSSAFPVEAGRTYEIRYQTRGQGVQGVHFKMFWLDADGKQVKWFVIGPWHGGDWAWEEVRQRLTIPSAGVAQARIEFWGLAAGGAMWVDNVSVRPLSGRPMGWAAAKYDVKVPRVAGKLPDALGVVTVDRPTRTVVFSARPRSAAKLTGEGIEVTLVNGMKVQFVRDGNNLLGIGTVKLGTLDLRNPAAPPIAPLVLTASGGHFTSCRYRDHKIAPDGTVTVRTTLASADGEVALDWIIKPVVRDIAGRPYTGLAYHYVVNSPNDPITEVADRSTWELGGRAEGVSVVTHNPYQATNLFRITRQSAFCGMGGTRFAGGEGEDYQFAPEGGLAVFYDERIWLVRSRRNASLPWIAYRDSMPQPSVKSVRTPAKCVLYCREGSHDEWTRVHDYVYDRHAGFWGIKQHTPLPLLNCWMDWRERAKYKEKVLYHIADEMILHGGRLGFKVIGIHSPWGDHGACALDYVRPGKKFGGTKAVKYLCDKARKHGMIVQAWAPAAHLWKDSPLLKENASWKIEGPGGKLPTTYCAGDLRGCRFRGGWMDYAVGAWKKIREETGLAALWIDSYANFTHGIQCADPVVAQQQAEDLFHFHAKLTELGYIVYTESAGTFGIPAPGFPARNLETATPKGPDPMTRYGASGYFGGNIDNRAKATNRLLTTGDYYYRSLANKSPVWLAWMTLKDTPKAHQKIARANRDYTAVVDKMIWRTTLTEDRGVEWTNPDDGTRILFSYKKARYTCPGLTSVRDVTAGKAVSPTGGGFMTEPSHTYRITTKN